MLKKNPKYNLFFGKQILLKALNASIDFNFKGLHYVSYLVVFFLFFFIFHTTLFSSPYCKGMFHEFSLVLHFYVACFSEEKQKNNHLTKKTHDKCTISW